MAFYCVFIVGLPLCLSAPAQGDPLSDLELNRVTAALKSVRSTVDRLAQARPAGGGEHADLRALREALKVLEHLGYDPFVTQDNRCHEERKVPASGAQISAIENSFAQTDNEALRLLVLRTVARTHFFSTRQVTRLLGSFSEQAVRADALILLHPRLIDPSRFHTLLGLLVDVKETARVVESTAAPKAP